MVSLRVLILAVSIAVGRAQQQGTGINDIITNVPGLNFNPTFKQYSGYLNATNGHNIFYWLVESQNNPSTDPLLLWLQGGPGCSGMFGFVQELGPFHLNPDGHTLWENVFTWNKFSNVLFIESPTGVGFSYSDPKNDTTDDDLTAHYNYEAMRDFFYNKFPEYQTHDFYVTGESYGGVYVPTLAKLLIDGIAAKEFPDNFRGMATGNGYLSHGQQFNSLFPLLYYHGVKGPDEWNALLQACCPNMESDQCDFYSQRYAQSDCGDQIRQYYDNYRGSLNDEYNMYQDCYTDTNDDSVRRASTNPVKPGFLFRPKPTRRIKSLPPGTSDMSHQINYDSTDAEFGFQCWADETVYFNDLNVKQALHVAESLWEQPWCSCCNIPYTMIYYDMNDTFAYILKNSNIRILVYNGDVDTACNFLGDQWFVEREVAPENNLQVVKERAAWNYRHQIAGFVKQFERLDLITVKGSGHFVPEDRAGPALQMIFNFIQQTGDYSKATGIDVTPKPLTAKEKRSRTP